MLRLLNNLQLSLTLSKLLERTIDSRFTHHAVTHNLFSPVQSAYRKYHSTETALVKIYADNSSSPVQTVSARALSCCRHRTRLPQEHAISCVRTCVSDGTPIGHEQRHGRATLSAQVR